MKFSAQVDQYIAKKTKWSELLTLLREIIGASELEETIKWGVPTYTLDGKNIIGLGAFKSFAALWFFQGALLNDPLKVLEMHRKERPEPLGNGVLRPLMRLFLRG